MAEKRKKMKRDTLYKIISAGLAVVVISVMAITGTVANRNSEKKPEVTAPPVTEDVNKTSSVSLVAVGDNLIHDTIINAGLKADGSYNFDNLYSNVKDTIKSADIAVINQETILGGSEFEYSGYPMFNTPWEVGEAAINAGFDVFLNATNHTMDKGSKGIMSAIQFYSKHPEVTYVGINKDSAEYNAIKVVEKNGIKIAMLNYTFGLNGIEVPQDKPWIVNLLEQKDKMLSDITAAKQQADVVMVFPHWGTEYSQDISVAQEELTTFFSENGVDIVIGTHPHVIEPIKEIKRPDGKNMLVYYSLGNFISHQNNMERMLGGMADLVITKTGTEVTFTGKVKPTVTQVEKKSDGGWEFGVYLLSDYTEDLAKAHRESSVSLESLNELSNKIFGEYVEK